MSLSCLAESATEAICLALHSVSHALKDSLYFAWKFYPRFFFFFFFHNLPKKVNVEFEKKFVEIIKAHLTKISAKIIV